MSDTARPLILRLTSDQLRKIADQLDAHTALKQAGADHPQSSTVLSVDGEKLAYLHWWDSGEQFMAEIINWTPGSATPLRYHEGGEA